MITATLNGTPLYVKGTMNVKLFDPGTDNMVYFSDKMSTSQLQSSINLGAINAGIGNPVVIQIPDTPNLTMNLTAADFSLAGRALSTGSDITYNAVVPVDEVVEATGTSLTVLQPPVAPLGGCNVVCTVGNGGTSYTIDPTTRQVQNFTATAGQSYCVHYWTNNASSQQFAVETLMSPAVLRGFVTMPLYATDSAASNKNSGSHVGNLYITIPRGQLSGDVSTDGSQTTPATTVMNLTALSYNEACEAGIQCGSSASPKLAYMVVELFGNPDQNAAGLAIVGGNDITVQAGTPYPIPVKYEMNDGEIVTPNMTDLTFTNPDGGLYFTVSNLGVITGTAAGSGTVVITSNYNTDLTTTADVTVTGGATNPTANVTFALTTPTTGPGNSLSGGGSTYDVTVDAVNGTQSVVITGTASATQSMVIGGTNASMVTLGGSNTTPTFTVNTSSIAAMGGSMSFTVGVTENGKSPIVYTVSLTVAQPQTAGVTFVLTTPAPGTGNTIEGGGAAETVTVNVVNATESVVLTGAAQAGQSIAVAGTNSSSVSAGGSATAPTYTVNTSSVAADGGSVNFTLTVSQEGYTTITYNVTVEVAAPPPDTADVTFALTTPSSGGSNTLSGGGSNKTVTVSVENTTSSVVITATKASEQSVAVGGTNEADVTPGGTDTNPTYTVDTTDIATTGGSSDFTLTVSQPDYTSIVYTVTITVAGA